MVAPEVAPFAKTGGLADVVGALPKVLAGLGHEVRTILPKYRIVRGDNLKPIVEKIEVKIGPQRERAAIKGSLSNGSLVYFVTSKKYFDREGLYGSSYGDYKDNDERFILFSRAILQFLKIIDYQPDVIHCHDWQSGLIPAYLKTIHRDDPFYTKSATLFTIHNLAYQGLFSRDRFPLTGLGWEEFIPEKLEFYNKFSFIKGGLVYSDAINTVSRGYAREIQTKEYGQGLDGVLRSRSEVLFGIINGLNYDEWDPGHDEFIFKKYDFEYLKVKIKNKINLLRQLRLPRKRGFALMGMVSRLAAQKGLDLLVRAMDELMGLPLQIVILGTGDKLYHNLLMDMARKYPRRLSINLTYDNGLAHKIYAASDIFLMPSRYEPCGLGQLISLKYGAVPVVRAIGGLKDTICEFDPKTGMGNGFVFKEYNPKAFLEAVQRALLVYKKKKLWQRLMINGMKENFSWDASANEYVKLYEKAISRHKAG